MDKISVEWKNGRVSGFKTIKAGERFVAMICQKVAPTFDYKLYSDRIK